ncbi:hypothetical protein EDB83DRAFT_2549282 [Lactarius deliciosus]|nr:hypothetical protein EDB83DRAFT_2549282 [Lactarius deliciosus]
MSALLNRLLGAFFVGVVFSSILYGVTWLQVYLYFTEHSSKDGAFLKSFVTALRVLDSIHLALLCHGFYIAAVTNFGNFLADLHAPWFKVSLGILCCQDLPTEPKEECLHATRYCLYRLSISATLLEPDRVLSTRVCYLQQSSVSGFQSPRSAVSETDPGFAIVFTVKSFQMGSYLENAPSVPYGASALSLEVACGVFITAGMVYYVLQQRSGAKRTKRVVNLVILYIVNSGALNLVFASTCLITYVKFPTTLIYAPSFFVLVRLYVCSFITILNSRVNVRSRLRGERRTVVTITHEQVIDGHPQSTLKLGSHSSSEMLAMMRIGEGTAEKAVGVNGDIC